MSLFYPKQAKEVALESNIKNWVTMDLLKAFTSYSSFQNMAEDLIQILDETDPAVAVLALEGLYRIEQNDVKSDQFLPAGGSQIENIKNFLRKWRCKSPLHGAYSGAFNRVPAFLRSLTIFKTFEVPLFIDNYGRKKLLSSYGSQVEDIDINGEIPIYHVTHCDEAQEIADEKRLRPSDNKNIIEGSWFGQLDNGCSVYGSKAFETTLSRLDVTGIHQGEVVSYKNEVNVILYATNDVEAGFSGLKKPKLTDDEVASGSYVKVSIFVPSGFLPETDADFDRVFSGPFDVEHSPFCVKALRLHRQSDCTELQ